MHPNEITSPVDALDHRMSFYGAVAHDAFKRADHHEWDAAAYAVIMAFKTFGESDDYPAWEKALVDSLGGSDNGQDQADATD